MCYYEGKEYCSDTARIINKFDVYVCDLGDCEDYSVSVGKKRPCVIVSSDNMNNPKSNKYHVAPIRTEHNMEVSKETLDDIVKAKREVGRIYVPLECSPGEFKFIDMSDTRPVSSKDIHIYKHTIINSETRRKINEAIVEYYFSDEELESVISNNLQGMEGLRYVTESYEDVIKSICTHKDIDGKSTLRDNSDGTAICVVCGATFKGKPHAFFNKQEDKKEEYISIPKYKKTKLPMGFTKYAELHSKGKMTIKEICEKTHKSPATVSRYLRIIKEQNEQSK